MMAPIDLLAQDSKKTDLLKNQTASQGRDLFADKTPQETTTEETPSVFQSLVTAGKAMMPDIDYNKVTGAGVGGAVFGAALPETTATLGRILSKVPYRPVRTAGEVLETGAPLLSTFGQRSAGAITGGILATGGEAGKQIAIEKGVDPKYANLIGIGIETLTPLFVSNAPKILRLIPGSRNVQELFSYVAREMGRDVNALTDAEKKFIALEADKMRGQGDGAGDFFKELQAGAETIKKEADVSATAIKKRAEQESLQTIIESGKQPSLADRIVVKAQSDIANVGDATSDLTNVGKNQRQAILDRFSEENLARDANYRNLKQQRDAVVSSKENSGDFISDLPEFKTAISELDELLLRGRIPLTTKTAQETEQTTLSAYEKIRDALRPIEKVTQESPQALTAAGIKFRMGTDPNTGNPVVIRQFPPSFNAIDTLRRKLGDVAFGAAKEGFEALGQKRAEKWYAILSKIQSKYAGQIQDELQSGYELSSGLLERFKGGPGAAVLKTEKLAPDMFTKNANEIPVQFFSSKDGPANLAALTNNPAIVEKTAADYVAINLKGKTADQVESWISSKGEFLKAPELANLRPKIDAYIKNLRAAETRAEGVRATGKAQEKRAFDIERTAAERAQSITDEAEKRVKLVLGDAFDRNRISEILSDPSKSLWTEVAGIMSKTPDGRQIVENAVAAHLADLAVKAERKMTAVNALERLREPLIQTGLVSPNQIDVWERQLATMRQPENAKIGWLSDQFIRRGSTIAGQYIGSMLGGMVPSLFGGQ